MGPEIINFKEILKKLNNNTHFLHSAVCVSRTGSMISHFHDTSLLKMKKLSDIDILEYLEKIKLETMLKYGVYQIEDLGKNLFEKIQNKNFNDSDFDNLVKNKENINSGIINSINDVSLFDETSLKLIYELPKNSFVMVSNKANNIFLAKINQITYENLKSTNENIQEYLAKTNINLIDDIYSSYDASLNKKYEVKIFNSNIDRIKDYFK